jgi:predicted CoA-binding protein
VPQIVDQVIELKMKVVRWFVFWIQLGIVNEEAAESARQSGLILVADTCLMIEH